jgi:hypothetical protein
LKNTDAAYLAGIIDGEGTITLTRMHRNENRRPVISIASTDIELLIYIKDLVGGCISKKKNYCPNKHKLSYSLVVKRKEKVLITLKDISSYLKVPSKINRATFILEHYEKVTPRNGKYNSSQLVMKQKFEEEFFTL